MNLIFKSLSFFLFLPLFCANGPYAVAEPTIDEGVKNRPTFERDVRPILKVACFHCHGEEEEPSGGLDLRLVRLMRAGGDSGPAIEAGADGSLLWERIASDEMPDGPKKLTPSQKAIIRRWLEEGAPTARPEPADVKDARFTLEELSHWAFQPIQRSPIPHVTGDRIRTPIDAFVAHRFRQYGLQFSAEADRATLIRRVTFDLTGLPPTPDEVQAFLSDQQPGAFERVVDRLLDSPQYGVRWGRHWLDVAGFSESDGGTGDDRRRAHAWRYRDYVIDAFNQNLPFDQFLVEQLAGDELAATGELSFTSRRIPLLAATGFLRMAPDATQSENTIEARNSAIAEVIKVVSSATIGLSVGCAQCHDHKYDPITIDDYYRYRAIFDPVYNVSDWRRPTERLIDVTPKDVMDERKRIEAIVNSMQKDLNERRDEVCRRIQAERIAAVPEKDRAATRDALFTEPGKRTFRQKELLDLYPMVKPIGTIRGLLVEYDSKSYRQLEKEQAKIEKIRQTMPSLHQIMAATETSVVPKSYVFYRGNPQSPKNEVAPGDLTVFDRSGRKASIPVNDPQLPTTGRRLAFARNLTDGTHPLVARVFVNRVWAHHLGRGIVTSLGDFGLSGDRPSHPELLDWLADDFVNNGWDVKRLHRMIVLSTVYRQTSRRSPKSDEIDPDNELLSRANLRRLDAEEIRDALLAVSGQLNRTLGGSSAPVTQDAEGKTVIGVRLVKDGLKAGVDRAGQNALRRSVYVETKRNLPLSSLAAFDLPAMTPNCLQRRSSTVATQSLWFLNDRFVVDASKKTAALILQNDSVVRHRHIDQLFDLLFSKRPTEAEMLDCQNYLADQTSEFLSDDAASQQEAVRQAFATLCQMLMASNRFLYVD